MAKHYTRRVDGKFTELRRSLPLVLHTVEINPDDGLPWRVEGREAVKAIEKQGRLHEYGWYVFNPTPATLAAFDEEQPLRLEDVRWDDATQAPKGTHPKRTPKTLELRRRLFAEGCELLLQTDRTQTADYVGRYPLKAATWDAWRHGVRSTVKALKAGTQDPRTVTWDEPPEPIEDTIE